MPIILYKDMSLKQLYRAQAEEPDSELFRALIQQKQAERTAGLARTAIGISLVSLVASLASLAGRFLGF